MTDRTYVGVAHDGTAMHGCFSADQGLTIWTLARFDAGWRKLLVKEGDEIVAWIDRIDGRRVWSARETDNQ